MIISAFPGTGKSYYCRNYPHGSHQGPGISWSTPPEALDSDSSSYSWIQIPDGERVRNPQFPHNYIQHIREAHEAGKLVFVSSHKEVRDALVAEGLPFLVIYPHKSLKGEYLKRFEERGSPQGFIDLLDQKWNEWIDELDEFDCMGLILTNADETITNEEHNWVMIANRESH